ncbi:nicotinamide/nicotinic acid mononucleotide adenylyltransferase 3-like isoform X2 [Babylonia areolata]|uniref:nicotinamide/nicotinic acid mononucleotide adenylyltransferase 3-like isoform X2 n=1 Tax=Babylonia areolata TaxID=304850 RepID=UPI003FD47AF3
MNSLNNLKRNMAATPKVILLACGSFNPVTNMHLRMFELGRDALNKTGRFKVVGGIISPVSDSYKKKDLAPAKDRCNMLRQALKTSDWVKLDSWECEQPTWLETEKVLRHHQAAIESQYNGNIRPSATKRRKKTELIEDCVDNAYERSPEGEDPPLLKLLCGADLLESFGTPGLWADEDIEKIVGKYGLVCITRAGSNPQKFIYDSDVLTKYSENIHIVTEWMTNEISATKVRRAVKRGESVKYLLPDPVISYIREHGLYGWTDNKAIDHLIPSPDEEEIMSPLSLHSEEEMMVLSSSSSGEPLASPSSGHAPSLYRCSTGSPSNSSDEDTAVEGGPGERVMRQPAGRVSPRVLARARTTPCMTDIGTLMRRVKNYNLRLFQTNTAQK